MGPGHCQLLEFHKLKAVCQRKIRNFVAIGHLQSPQSLQHLYGVECPSISWIHSCKSVIGELQIFVIKLME